MNPVTVVPIVIFTLIVEPVPDASANIIPPRCGRSAAAVVDMRSSGWGGEGKVPIGVLMRIRATIQAPFRRTTQDFPRPVVTMKNATKTIISREGPLGRGELPTASDTEAVLSIRILTGACGEGQAPINTARALLHMACTVARPPHMTIGAIRVAIVNARSPAVPGNGCRTLHRLAPRHYTG